jgi:hypothetical protein
MTSTRSLIARALFTIVLVLGASAPLFAQTQVRVTRDRATIWRREAAVPATTVKAGTILDVVGRDGDWYIVLIPAENGGNGEAGLIAASLVQPLGGPPAKTIPRSQAGPTAARRPAAVEPPRGPIEVLGSVDVGLNSWLAHKTFDAVVGHPVGPIFGAGVQLRFKRRLFVEGAFDFFQQDGQRVFVSGSSVFPLGIRDTVRVIPLEATVGYRHPFRKFAAYVGGGGGAYLYKETSDFSDPSENVSQTFASYHAVGGFEFEAEKWFKTDLEVQFTTVPNALGASGASAAFNEHNLGGVQARLKILFGR